MKRSLALTTSTLFYIAALGFMWSREGLLDVLPALAFLLAGILLLSLYIES